MLDNRRVSEQDILAGHFHATQARSASVSGPILVLRDTTEFSFTRSDIQAIGQTGTAPAGPQKVDGRRRRLVVVQLDPRPLCKRARGVVEVVAANHEQRAGAHVTG